MLDATEEPAVRMLVLNGVAVPSDAPVEGEDYYPDHERHAIRSLRRYVRRGDRVVVVGGGWGASAVVAARMTHFEGDVVVYEPTSEMIAYIERAIEVNGVDKLVTVEHAAIGPIDESTVRIFGDADGDRRPPSAIPDCDVIDIDCEGAELAVLRGLEHRPRVIVVEVHPHLGPTEAAVREELDGMGYDVVDDGALERTGDITVLTAEQRAD